MENTTTELPSDPRPSYARALTQTAGLVAAVRQEQLGDPTPCEEYDVRALLCHLVGGIHRAAVIGEQGDALGVPAWIDGVSDDGWPAAFEAARARAVAAWADDTRLDTPVTVPWGTVPGRAALTGYLREVLAHGWDLAVATGQQTELDQDLARYALAGAQRFLPAEPRGGPIPFAPVQPAPAGAGAYAQLAAWLGRKVPQDA